MYGLGFFSFNIVGLSSPLLPCRLVDLRRGLLYSRAYHGRVHTLRGLNPQVFPRAWVLIGGSQTT